MSDKQLGYILMLLILLLTGVVVFYAVRASYSPMEPRTLRFPEVGSLAVQDPVRMEGIQIGEITGFEHDDSGRVLVYIRSSKPVPVRTSSQVSVKVKGVMGERFIEISSGNLADPLIDKSVIIDGKFEMGPSEAIVYMDLLAEKIAELKDIMLWLRDGKDDGKRPFIVAFNDIVGTIDTLAYKLLTGLAGLEEGLGEGLEKAADIAVKTGEFTVKVSAKAPEVIDDVSALLAKIDELIPKVEKVIAQTNSIAEKIDDNKFLWGDHAEKFQKTLGEIKKFVDDVRRDGMPLPIKLRFF